MNAEGGRDCKRGGEGVIREAVALWKPRDKVQAVAKSSSKMRTGQGHLHLATRRSPPAKRRVAGREVRKEAESSSKDCAMARGKVPGHQHCPLSRGGPRFRVWRRPGLREEREVTWIWREVALSKGAGSQASAGRLPVTGVPTGSWGQQGSTGRQQQKQNVLASSTQGTLLPPPHCIQSFGKKSAVPL